MNHLSGLVLFKLVLERHVARFYPTLTIYLASSQWSRSITMDHGLSVLVMQRRADYWQSLTQSF